MFKLVVLSALLAVAAARPGLIGSPVVYSAPAVATVAVQESVLAKVGDIVKSVPTSVSHQSQSVVHSHAHVVEDVVAPVVKSTPVVTYSAAPVVHTYAAAAPVFKTIATPLVHTSYAAAPVLKSVASPVVYSSAW